MRELVLTPKFEKAFHRLTRKNPALQSQIEAALQRMAENLNDPRLKTQQRFEVVTNDGLIPNL